jgi:hypothetical protein
MKNNIPTLVQQIRDNMLDQSNPENIRYNYMISMEAIRDYAESALREYNKKVRR